MGRVEGWCKRCERLCRGPVGKTCASACVFGTHATSTVLVVLVCHLLYTIKGCFWGGKPSPNFLQAPPPSLPPLPNEEAPHRLPMPTAENCYLKYLSILQLHPT